MRPNDFDILLCYSQEPNDDNTLWLLTFGLKMLKDEVRIMQQRDTLELVKTIAKIYKDPLLTMLYLHAGFAVTVEKAPSTTAIASFRTQLAAIKQFVPASEIMTPEFHVVDRFHEWLGMVMENAISVKYSKANETSAITGSAIIAPYVGTLRKPYISMTRKGEKVYFDYGEEPVYEAFSIVDLDISDNPALTIMKTLTMTNQYCAELMNHADTIYEILDGKDASNYLEMASLFTAACSRGNLTVNDVVRHACLGYIAINHDGLSEQHYSQLKDLVIPMDQLKSYEDSVKAVNDLFKPASEAVLMGSINRDVDKRFFKYESSNADQLKEETPLFDVSSLVNWMVINRRYYYDAYTNTRFMNIPRIKGYFFYQGFLIIEPQNEDGTPSNFVYVPVRDELNGRRIAIIKYWRDGKIEAMTEQEYNTEARVSGPTMSGAIGDQEPDVMLEGGQAQK